jgi:hypothetical protein
MPGQKFLDEKQFQNLQITNQTEPKEGPRCVPLLLDFTAFDTFIADLKQFEAKTRISMIQTVFIDLSGSDAAMTVLARGTNQTITAKPRTQGYYNILASNPTELVLQMTNGPAGVRVFLINVPIAGAVWASQ